MRTRLFLAAIAAMAVGCGSSAPSGPTTLVVISLSINGPATIAPGETVVFSALARMNDGSTQDFTAKATWRTNSVQILTISSAGQATAKTTGETQIIAVAQSKTATANVMVIPPGTFRLTGTVTESGLPVSDASVSVTSGIGTGLSATTDFNGQYRIYGVAGEIELTVSKAGYTPVAQRAVVATSSVIDMSIAQSSAVRDLTGTYALRIAADAGCAQSTPFPNELKERRYTATVTQTGPVWHVKLSGATFQVSGGAGDNFSGRIEPSQISFVLGDGYYTPYPDILESLGDGRVILVQGSGTLSLSGSDLVGSLSGALDLGNSKQPLWTFGWYLGSCYSSTITVTMTRQSAVPARIRR